MEPYVLYSAQLSPLLWSKVVRYVGNRVPFGTQTMIGLYSKTLLFFLHLSNWSPLLSRKCPANFGRVIGRQTKAGVPVDVGLQGRIWTQRGRGRWSENRVAMSQWSLLPPKLGISSLPFTDMKRKLLEYSAFRKYSDSLTFSKCCYVPVLFLNGVFFFHQQSTHNTP